MSHYVVQVIIPKDTDFSEKVVGKILEPFDENIDVEPYQKKCSCIGFKAKMDVLNELQLEMDPIRDEFKEFCTLNDIQPFTSSYDYEWNKRLEPILKKEKELLQIHPLKDTPNPKCDDCDGKGFYESTYNPQSKWDWYSIGGRWDGRYKEFKSQDDDNILSVDKLFNASNRYIDVLESLNWDMTRLDKLDIKPPNPFSFALVTPGSDWFSRGEMGWWAVVSCETETQTFYRGFIKLLERYRGHEVVVVDLHI